MVLQSKYPYHLLLNPNVTRAQLFACATVAHVLYKCI